ncbi:MAG: outer membrane beta-barrel protein [Bacteroidota bacterium]
MRKLFVLFFLIWTAIQVQAQWGIGLRVGTGSTSLNGQSFNVTNSDGLAEFGLALREANLGFHGGLVIHYERRAFIFQPEILFNTGTAEYELTDLNSTNEASEILKERFNYLDIPVLFGLRVGPLHFHAGPVGHVFLSNTSDLGDVDGFRQDFEELTVGYQLGGGLDIWNLSLDVRYEGNFTEFGNQISFGTTSYDFDDAPARWLFSIAWIFYGEDDDDDDD